MLNTVVFTLAAVIGSMVLGLMLAMLLDQPLRGRNLVRSTVFAPFVISGAAVGLAAQFVFDPHFGLVQDLLHRVGVGVPDFYQDPHWAMFMVTVTYIWKNLGYTFVIYLAALQGCAETCWRRPKSTAPAGGPPLAGCCSPSCARRRSSCRSPC